MMNEDYREQYAYLCLMRPPVPGAIPREGLEGVDFKEGVSLSGHHYWGHAVYSRQLTDEELNHYDLEKTAIIVLD